MRTRLLPLLSALLVATALSAARAQNPPKAPPKKHQDLTGATPKEKLKIDTTGEPVAKRTTKFFDGETPVTTTLTVNVKRIRGDKEGEKSPWRSATLSYVDSTGSSDTIPIKVRTRGNWRLAHCEYPPIRLNFSNATAKKTVFKGLDKPKLVNYCKNFDDYEQYILQEMQLYRVYNLLTPASNKVRLLRMTYTDSATGKPVTTRWAFIEEEPELMAQRNGGRIIKQQGAGPNDLEPFADALFGVFEYFIGNTDFAPSVLHNTEIITNDKADLIPVAYDFDYAGAVNAKYAAADPRLNLKSVRQRLFRGYCVPDEEFQKVFALFQAQKDAIYGLYHDAIGKLMDPKVVEDNLAYYDEFYKTIGNPRTAKGEIIDACIGKR